MTTLTRAQRATLFASAHTQHTVSIRIPSTNNAMIDGTKIKADASPELRSLVLNGVCKLFAKTFGGFECADVLGGWIDSDTLELVREVSTVVSSACGELTIDHLAMLEKLAHSVRVAFQQDAVMLSIDNAAWFVTEGWQFPRS